MKKNERRILSILLAISMVMTMGLGSSFAATTVSTTSSSIGNTPSNTSTDAEEQSVYKDIRGHWAEAVIEEAASLKLVGGYPDGKFLPDHPIKREEFLKLVTNVLTETPDVSKTEIKFSDVVADEWYVPTIKIAVAGNITKGYEDGTFGIGRLMSRQEAAKVVASVIPTLDIPQGGSSASSVKDKAQIGEWAYNYVDIMFKKGYLKGDTEGNFRPAAALTRAEATVILLNLKKNETIIAANANELAMNDCLKIHKGEIGAFVKGKGTAEKPYEISTEEQLNHIREHTSGAAFYVLTNNIKITKDFATTVPKVQSGDSNWSNGNFVPIGTKENPFQGHFDGNNHSISGLNIIGIAGGSKGSGQKERNAASYAGFFGYVGEGGSVESLILDSSTIEGWQYTGGIVAYNRGTIKNCTLEKGGAITGNLYTGGITGYSEKPLVNNKNKGNVTSTGNNTGGIVGSVNTTSTALEDCVNRGNVTGTEMIGGVAGSVTTSLDGNSVVKECSNQGTVKGGTNQVGGILGVVDGSLGKIVVENCFNEGTLTGIGVIGGVVGQVKSNKVTVSQCYNEGTVTGGSVGGVVGNNEGIVQYSYNKGSLVGNIEAGGVIAFQQTEKAITTKCYNEGTVTSVSNAGGIIGINDTKLNNCYNRGTVKGTNSIGGIAGKNKGTIETVYGAGQITASNGAGSLVGRNAGTLKNSFWLEGTATADVGLSDSGDTQLLVKKLTKEELSGQKKIKTAKGYEMVIDIMNNNNITTSDPKPNAVWKYEYKIISEASNGSTTVISDGGGIVKPVVESSTDETGNVIDPSDVDVVYLYPCIIEL